MQAIPFAIRNSQLAIIGSCIALISLITSSGCSLIVHPFRDELANQPPVTTASVETVQAAAVTRHVQQHDWPAVELFSQNGAVTHGALYFEDEFADNGSKTGSSAWTWRDYLQVFYWRGRYLLNIIAFPVNVAVTPPWTVMESDGVECRGRWGWDHDAERAKCVEPCATAEVEPTAAPPSEPANDEAPANKSEPN